MSGRTDIHYVYMLRCRDGSFYIGMTRDLERRVHEHQEGRGSAHTWRRRPVTLIWFERHESGESAARRERMIKGWTHAKKESLVARSPSRSRAATGGVGASGG